MTSKKPWLIILGPSKKFLAQKFYIGCQKQLSGDTRSNIGYHEGGRGEGEGEAGVVVQRQQQQQQTHPSLLHTPVLHQQTVANPDPLHKAFLGNIL